MVTFSHFCAKIKRKMAVFKVFSPRKALFFRRFCAKNRQKTAVFRPFSPRIFGP